MSNRLRAIYCAIAVRDVGISLRHGGGPHEPGRAYVRCDERDCQYVDVNESPCPLTPAMFDDGSDQRLAVYLHTNAGRRFCYACLTVALAMSHDQLRRASWQSKDGAGASIGPARCGVCQRRGVTIGVARQGPSEASILTPGIVEAVGAYLRERPGFTFCAHCLAHEVGAWPAVIRQGMAALASEPAFLVRTAECVNCLLRKPVIRFGDHAAGGGQRRVVDFVAHAPGEAFCAGCIALSTGLGLAEARRIVQGAAPVPEVERAEGVCSGCGRSQTLIRLRGGESVESL